MTKFIMRKIIQTVHSEITSVCWLNQIAKIGFEIKEVIETKTLRHDELQIRNRFWRNKANEIDN